jgi:hypothetical protein
MKRKCLLFYMGFVLAAAQAQEGPIASSNNISVRDGWVTVTPAEFQGAINNPLKGFRSYKQDGYGLLERQYIKWNEIEVSADDTWSASSLTPE